MKKEQEKKQCEGVEEMRSLGDESMTQREENSVQSFTGVKHSSH